MGEMGFGKNEMPNNGKEIGNQTSKINHDFPEMKSEPLEIREKKFQDQLSNLQKKGEKLGFGVLSEETKKKIQENTVGKEARKSLEASQERELKRELNENDLIIPEGKDIEDAEKILKENGVPCEVEKYIKGVDSETGRVPAEFVLVINDPQHADKPAPFDFVKKVFQFLQDNEIVVRYAKNPEQAGAEMENENQE